MFACLLKGKFSSGIEGTIASTLNCDFNWKQLSEIILCIFCDVFKVYLSNIDSETAEEKKRRLSIWACSPITFSLRHFADITDRAQVQWASTQFDICRDA